MDQRGAEDSVYPTLGDDETVGLMFACRCGHMRLVCQALIN